MERCEVCQNLRPAGDLKPGRPLEEVQFDVRSVRLCRAHAGIAKNSRATSFAELRELYSESVGTRSYVPRRSPSEKDSVLGPRNFGRRQNDAP